MRCLALTTKSDTWNPPPTHPESRSPLQAPFKSSDPTLMLRQDRQSGTITRKQEEEGREGRKGGREERRAEGQRYTQRGNWALKVGPSDPGGPPSLIIRQERRQRETETGGEDVRSFSFCFFGEVFPQLVLSDLQSG